MKTLRAVLALALTAAPAGALQMQLRPAPKVPAVALGLPLSAIASSRTDSALGPAALDARGDGTPFNFQTQETSRGDLTSFRSLLNLGSVDSTKPGAPAGDAQRWSIGFDGASLRVKASATDSGTSGPGSGSGSGSSFTGGSRSGSGSSSGSGSGSGGGSNSGSGGGASSGGSPLAGLVAHIEATGQVQANSQTGAAIKTIQPKREQTPNSATIHGAALTGKAGPKGSFTKEGIIAVRQSLEVSETPLSATTRKVVEKQTATNVKAGLDGKAVTVQSVVSDHTDVIETIKHDPQAKQHDFQKELAAAERITGTVDMKTLGAWIAANGQLDMQALFSGGAPRFFHELEQKQTPDGTTISFIAMLELDAQGQPASLSLIRTSSKLLSSAGKSNKAREEETVYTADPNGKVLEATFTGKDHSLDVHESNKPADAAAQSDFDAIVAKLAQP